MNLVGLLLVLLVFVPFCISRTLNDGPPVDGEKLPVDGVGDEGTLNKLVNGLLYKVDDDIHEKVDSEDAMVDEMGDKKGPIRAEELWRIPYSKRKHP